MDRDIAPKSNTTTHGKPRNERSQSLCNTWSGDLLTADTVVWHNRYYRFSLWPGLTSGLTSGTLIRSRVRTFTLLICLLFHNATNLWHNDSMDRGLSTGISWHLWRVIFQRVLLGNHLAIHQYQFKVYTSRVREGSPQLHTQKNYIRNFFLVLCNTVSNAATK